MGGLSKLMGGPGAGAAAKLINQLLTACNAHAASEALALARSLGLDSPAQVAGGRRRPSRGGARAGLGLGHGRCGAGLGDSLGSPGPRNGT